MKRFFSRFFSKKRALILAAIAFFVLGAVMAATNSAWAADGTPSGISGALGDALSHILGWIAFIFIEVGKVLLQLLFTLIFKVAAFNNFIHVSAVRVGWVLVRDLVNTFFVLALIVIAFGTILRKEKYSYKTLLPRFVLSAILVNFSRTIAGLYIDLAQVVMLTFVKAAGETVSSNVFFSRLGLDAAFQIGQGVDVSNLTLAASIIFALMAMIAVIITVGTFLLVLVIRIVAIWTLVILSPLPYLLAVFPTFQSRMGQWWDKFTQYLTVGPVLAFFLWLALTIISTPNNLRADLIGQGIAVADQPVGITQITDPANFLSLIVVLTLLIVGLQLASEIGGSIGALAGAAAQKISSITTAPARGALAAAKLGYDVGARKMSLWTSGTSDYVLRPGMVYEALKAGYIDKARKEEEKIDAAKTAQLQRGGLIGALRGAGATDFIDNYAQQWFYASGLKKIWSGGKASLAALESKKEEAEKDVKANESLRDRDISNIYGEKLKSATATDKAGILDDYVKDEVNKKFGSGYYEKLNKDEKKKMRRTFLPPKDEDKVIAAGVLKKAIGEFDASDAGKVRNDKIKKYKDKFEKYKEKAEDVGRQVPISHEGRAKFRAQINEEAKKSDTTNDNELRSFARRAAEEKDGYKMLGVMQSAAKAGHLNEILKEFGRSAGKKGLWDFTDKILIKKLNIPADAARAAMNDIATIAVENRQTTFDQAFKALPDGSYVANDKGDNSQQGTYGEMLKRDKEDLVRKANRFGYMDEETDGKAYFNQAGLSYVVDSFGAFAKEIANNRMNANAAAHMSTKENLQSLRNAGESAYKGDRQQLDAFKDFLKKLETYGRASADKQATGVAEAFKSKMSNARQAIERTPGRPNI